MNNADELSAWQANSIWNEKLSEDIAVNGMQFLKEFSKAYEKPLIELKKSYNSNKNNLSQRNDVQLKTIEERKEKQIYDVTNEYNRSLINCEKEEKNLYATYHGALVKFVDTVSRPYNGMKNSAVEAGLKGQIAALDAVKTKEINMVSMIVEEQKKKRAYLKEYYDRRVRTINAKADYDVAEQQEQYAQWGEELSKKLKKDMLQLEKQYSATFQKIMSHENMKEYWNLSTVYEPDYTSYSCSKRIPEHVYLGELSSEIMDQTTGQQEVAAFLLNQGKGVACQTGNKIIGKIPYCMNLEDGISLFLNYSPSDRGLYQKHLQMLLLKLFMEIPAGKLEATMIDPLELGETFAMFAKLGAEESRIIDTKIWSQEKDISSSINLMRQKLETMTQAYGNDKATRLKKEPLRVLAITDFPNGFNQNALRDLQAIVRKSASYGVGVFIWANSDEISKLEGEQQSVYNEIRQMLHVVTAQGNYLKLENAKYPDMALELDLMSEAKNNIPQIIDTIAAGIHNSQQKIELFEDMFEDIDNPNTWFRESTIQELAIPIGIKGANTIVKMIIGKKNGSTAHHALIAGPTGAGKSTLLHTIIMSTMLNYSPDEVQLYLVDFKEGVEFKPYTQYNFPSLKVVAIDSEREFGLNIMKELCKEMERRADLFSRDGYEEISDYRKGRNVKVPKIVMIFDEVQELFRNTGKKDNINEECIACLGKLVTLGRAMGIHVVLACQDFKLVPSIQSLFTSMAIRIAIRGSEGSAQSVLGDHNPGAKQLQDGAAGAAVFNDAGGVESANVIFQVAYLDKGKRKEYLNLLNSLQNNGAFAELFPYKTRVLLTNAEDDVFNVFNQFAVNKNTEAVYDDAEKYALFLGEGFDLKRKFRIGMEPKQKCNLLIIGSNEKRVASMFYLSMLSILYGECANSNMRLDNQLISLVDLSVGDDYTTNDLVDFQSIKQYFDNQIKRATMHNMDEMISSTYRELCDRMDGMKDSSERLFLMFFGINRAHRLVNASIYDEEGSGDEISTLDKLKEIIKRGAAYGINCICWGEDLESVERILGGGMERDFSYRIVCDASQETMQQLVMERNPSSLRETTAVYMDVANDIKNTHFRPYEIPTKFWVNKIAKVYHQFEKERNQYE